jgi:hypothetical protein
MKSKFLFIIFNIFISSSLLAIEGLDDAKKKELEDFINKVKNSKEFKDGSYNYRLNREYEINNDHTCVHCPKYLLLTEKVNKVIDKLQNEPNIRDNQELPVKVNKLKFMYYEESLFQEDGKSKCTRFMDYTPDLKPTKFDGQFKLIAEDVLKFNEVSSITYMNPKLDEVVYYYRGEGADKNLIVQAILSKNGGKLRYFRYYPTEQERNPYNLPDLDGHATPIEEASFNPISKLSSPETGLKLEGGNSPGSNDKYGIKIKKEVEMRNKWIPKNVHFVEAYVEKDLGDYKISGKSDTSIKGNEASMALRDNSKDLVVVSLESSLTGETKHKVVVPYSVRVFDDSDSLTMKGRFEKQNDAQIVSASLTDNIQEYVRGELRRNTSNDRVSYVLARDVKYSSNETLSYQIGKDEVHVPFAAIKHSKSIKDNTTLVLDVKVDKDKNYSIMYQVNHRF